MRKLHGQASERYSVHNEHCKVPQLQTAVTRLVEVRPVLEIIQAATSHRFHHTILTKEGATIALNEIKKLARSRGLVPVINNPKQFSQLETSYMLKYIPVKTCQLPLF